VDKDSKRERESPRKREQEGNREKDMDICRQTQRYRRTVSLKHSSPTENPFVNLFGKNRRSADTYK
jgi:hypothetical protein